MRTLADSTKTGNPSSWAAIPERIQALLKLEDLNSPQAWRKAGRRRHQLFGIVPSTVRVLDALARCAR